MIDLSKYELKEKYREVLDDLSDDDKIRIAIENYDIAELKDIVIYYDLQENPLLRTIALEKYGKDPESAFYYAHYVIQGRWLEAEEVIKTDPEYACAYAQYVIKGRWHEAEDIIKTDSEWALEYVRDVIKGRWLEAEEYIKKDPEIASYYAEHVMKDRNFWDNN